MPFTKFFSRHVGAFALLVFCLCLAGVSRAQQWDTNVLTWTNPTTCSTGEPIAQCPIIQIRVEESATSGGTFKNVTTLATVAATYTHVGVTAGQHCYRVIVASSKGDSSPSNVFCKTNTKPVGPPNPPTNLQVVEPIAFNVKPDFQHFAFLRGSRAGKVTIGSSCDGSRITKDGYAAISRPRAVVTPRPEAGSVLVAKCAA